MGRKPSIRPEISARSAARGATARESRREKFEPLAVPDPSTGCDRQYSAEETEVLAAMADYQKRTGRRFPSYCEVLAVLQGLGYRKVQPLPC